MFGWLKGAAQDAVYRSTVDLIAAKFGHDVGTMAAVNVGAAMNVVRLARRMKGVDVLGYPTLADPALITGRLTSDEWYRLENEALAFAAQVKGASVTSEYVFQLAAGWFSLQKRGAFDSPTSVAIMTAVRNGAETAVALNISGDDNMSYALPKVVEHLPWHPGRRVRSQSPRPRIRRLGREGGTGLPVRPYGEKVVFAPFQSGYVLPQAYALKG